MGNDVRARVYITNNGRVPFIEQFRRLDKQAAAEVTTRLFRDLRILGLDDAAPIGKVVAHGLRQSGHTRDHGASTRVLFTRRGKELILFGVFVKNENSDNVVAINHAAALLGELEDNETSSEMTLADTTELLCIEPQPENKKRPLRARLATSETDLGVLDFAAGRDLTMPRTDGSFSGDRGWEEARLEAERNRGAVTASAQLEVERAGAAVERQQRRSLGRAAREFSKARLAMQHRDEIQWQHPPFNLDLLIKWMALDEEIAFHRSSLVPEERAFNEEARVDFERYRDEEVAALRRGEAALTPRNAEEEKERREYLADLEQRIEAAYSEVMADRTQLDKMMKRVREKNRQPAVFEVKPCTRARHAELAAELGELGRQYFQLDDIQIRRGQVEAETYKPILSATRRLKTLLEQRDRVVDDIGAKVLAANYPAIRRALTPPDQGGPRKGKGVAEGQQARRRRVAALIARTAYEENLGFVDEIFAGITDDQVGNPAVRQVVDEVTTNQCKLKIPPGTALAPEVRQVLDSRGSLAS